MIQKYDVFHMIGNTTWEQKEKIKVLFNLFQDRDNKIYGLFLDYGAIALSFEYMRKFLKYQKILIGFDGLFFVDENLNKYAYFVITDVVRGDISAWI